MNTTNYRYTDEFITIVERAYRWLYSVSTGQAQISMKKVHVNTTGKANLYFYLPTLDTFTLNFPLMLPGGV